MTVKPTFALSGDASQRVRCHVVFRPKGAGTAPSLIGGAIVSSVARDSQGVFIVTMKSAQVAVVGTATVNSPTGVAKLWGYIEHTHGEATFTVKLHDAAGAVQDLDLSAGGTVVCDLEILQVPVAVK